MLNFTLELTPRNWEAILGFEIIDPDGWDRSNMENFSKDWEMPVSFNDFMDKADVSTCSRHYPREVLREVAVNKLRRDLVNLI